MPAYPVVRYGSRDLLLYNRVLPGDPGFWPEAPTDIILGFFGYAQGYSFIDLFNHQNELVSGQYFYLITGL